MTVHTILRNVRRERKIRQHHVAGAIGLSVSEVSRIERGRRRLRVDQLGAWATALGVHILHMLVPDEASGRVLARLNDAMMGMGPEERRAFIAQLEAVARYAEGHQGPGE